MASLFTTFAASNCDVSGCTKGRDAAVPDPKSPPSSRWERAVCMDHFIEHRATGRLEFKDR